MEEALAIRAFGLKNPICIIPNGVDLPPHERGVRPGGSPQRLVYLGRLHPKKNLLALLDGWKSAWEANRNVREWKLVLAGWDQCGYTQQLSRKVGELDLAASVEIVGPKFGAAKDELLRSSTGFILPSLSEGLPVVVLEAWAYALPVLMTPQCNVPSGFAAGAAIEINSQPDSIAQGIAALCCLGEMSRQDMGLRGRQLVAEEFTWSKVASKMAEVYTWVCSGGRLPSSLLAC
jgi:glycosyltransferase involved in cell wall biosynthesis